MTTTLREPERIPAPQTTQERHVTEQEARAVAEAARETEWTRPSFLKELFGGNLRLDLIHPYPSPDPEEEARAGPFLERLEAVLQRVDGDQIEREQGIPDEIVDDLKAIGAFGIKIPREYGGLGLSQRTYVEAIGKVASVDGSLTEALDTHLLVAGDLIDPTASVAEKVKALLRAAAYYGWWYPTRWIEDSAPPHTGWRDRNRALSTKRLNRRALPPN